MVLQCFLLDCRVWVHFNCSTLWQFFTGGQEGCFRGLSKFDSRWEVCCMEALRSGQLYPGAWCNLDTSTSPQVSPVFSLRRPWTCFYKCWSQDLPHTCPKPTLLTHCQHGILRSMHNTCPSIGSLTSDVVELPLRSRVLQQSFSCSLLPECSRCT